MRIGRICWFAICGLTKKFACPLLALVHFHCKKDIGSAVGTPSKSRIRSTIIRVHIYSEKLDPVLWILEFKRLWRLKLWRGGSKWRGGGSVDKCASLWWGAWSGSALKWKEGSGSAWKWCGSATLIWSRSKIASWIKISSEVCSGSI
jgi:hypothetical protein